MSALPTFPDRVRFNWGFHDGSLAAREDWPMLALTDSVYAEGYARGVLDFNRKGKRAESSDEAWDEYQAVLARRTPAAKNQTNQQEILT